MSAALMGAAVAPAAVAQPADSVARAVPEARADPRPPDAVDRANGYRPGLEDAGSGAPTPDGRDRATGYQPTFVPEVAAAADAAAGAASPPTVSGGFDWVSAGIGAAAGTGLLIVAMAFGATKLRPGRSGSRAIGA